MSAIPPYYGGKLLAAPLIWERVDRVNTASYPFSGMWGAGRGCPYQPKYEVLCDLDGHITNVLRALKWHPEQVAEHADWPISEIDLFARHRAVREARAELTQRLEADPEYSDPKLAGWWLWGASCWIGPGFGVRSARHLPSGKRQGVNTSHRRGATAGAASSTLVEACRRLSKRLRNATILTGDWTKAVTATALGYQADGRLPAAVFLDPPYPGHERMYVTSGEPVHAQAAEWAREHGDDPHLRIVLCGYEGDVDMPDSWECVSWKSKGKSANAARERIWFSPHCKRVGQLALAVGGHQ